MGKYTLILMTFIYKVLIGITFKKLLWIKEKDGWPCRKIDKTLEKQKYGKLTQEKYSISAIKEMLIKLQCHTTVYLAEWLKNNMKYWQACKATRILNQLHGSEDWFNYFFKLMHGC